nr:PadR family transcriptional regulator [Corynebacterium lactis]
MSIKHSLLTLIGEQPHTASELRAAFEEEMGGLFVLNQGQVSQTLNRLVRDQLAVSHEVTSPSGRTVDQYDITPAGRDELRTWWANAIEQPGPTRDELVIRFALAARREASAFIQLLDTQRFATLRQLRRINDEAASLPPQRTAERLNAERRIFELEGIIRWLDRIEALAPPDVHDPASTTAPAQTSDAKDKGL